MSKTTGFQHTACLPRVKMIISDWCWLCKQDGDGDDGDGDDDNGDGDGAGYASRMVMVTMTLLVVEQKVWGITRRMTIMLAKMIIRQ